MNARSEACSRALRRGDVTELIRLMLEERETIKLHPAYTYFAMAAVARGYADFVETNTQVTILKRRQN